ncbi:MAG: creatininase family protein [Spirochaetales bacterium]|nr:creatininase family protein [Spirochaetales bacterium]
MDHPARLDFLKPAEIDKRKEECPVIFLPIGTIEWHGLHNVVGLDAVKAHALCLRGAEMGGGVVHPPHYGAIGGLDEPHTFIFDAEEQLKSDYFVPWIQKWCREAARNGYKGIVLLTGHYGAAQQIGVRKAAVTMTKELGIPVIGVPEYFLALDEQYYGDHAAFFETSLMMELYPGSVDLDRLGEEPHQGVGGLDPKKNATREAGARYTDVIVARLAHLSRRLPQWSGEQIRSYARAEDKILQKQIDMCNAESCWGAWRHIGEGVLDNYPVYLCEERFDELSAIAEKL